MLYEELEYIAILNRTSSEFVEAIALFTYMNI